MTTKTCRGCGCPIIWIKMAAGKAMPCDPEPIKYQKNSQAKTRIVTEAGDVIWGTQVENERTSGGLEVIVDGVGYLPHWATCPQAKQFHGGNSKMVELQYYSSTRKEWVDAERDGKPIQFANRQEAETYLQAKDEEAMYKGCYKLWEYKPCEVCETLVALSGFTNTCDNCGADYNGFGQRLAPREQWGEETGETAADILAVDTEGDSDANNG